MNGGRYQKTNMKITKQYHFEDYGKLTPYYQAEQIIENGLLSFVQVERGATRMEAISNMLKKIYATNT